ncbi:MAG: nucleoside triphosphate pyrophosphohydrolase [Candidatus Wolfebacteria bacterium]|nr:nucleoside triphosphate pyrophosphohydrolase [Candidatus Wolfebacteria bacterium]
MKYDKLVRDKIPEYIKAKGGVPIFHIANNDEYWQKLKEKLQEEITEFLNDDTNVSEIADILDVIDAICEYRKFDKKEIDEIKKKKAEERGKFKKKIILDES